MAGPEDSIKDRVAGHREIIKRQETNNAAIIMMDSDAGAALMAWPIGAASGITDPVSAIHPNNANR